jgi:hypothetical protein
VINHLRSIVLTKLLLTAFFFASRSNLVGYVRWGARSDQFPPRQTIIPTAFRSQSGLLVTLPQPTNMAMGSTNDLGYFSQSMS